MTKIRYSGNDSHINDNSGGGGGGLGGLGSILGGGSGGGGGGMGIPIKAGGGVLGILVLLATLILPKLLGGTTATTSGGSGAGTTQIDSPGLPTGSGSGGGSANPATQGAADGSGSSATCGSTDLRQIICGAYEDATTYWQGAFQAAGRRFVQPNMTFFSGDTNTGCGAAQSSAGPFYCPADQTIYLDLDFLGTLEQQLKFGGDLAEQYVIAHEYGHHIQKLLGTSDAVEQADQQHPDQANALSVKLELQADCFAGIWAKSANDRSLLENGDLAEALGAASAVGDDTIQKETTGHVDPDTFTHGTSAQRQTWFNRGYTSGDTNQCNTFNE